MKKLLLTLIAMLFLITACGSNEAPKECVEQANLFVEYFKNKDFESMYEMTEYKDPYLAGTYNEDSEIGKKLFSAIADNLNYEITGGMRDGKSANVKLHIVTVDFNNLLTNVVAYYTEFCKTESAGAMSSEELDEVLFGILDEELKNVVAFEKDTQIDFVKKNGQWIIADNVGIYDDLSGGYLTYCFSVNSALGNIDVQN